MRAKSRIAAYRENKRWKTSRLWQATIKKRIAGTWVIVKATKLL